MKESQNTAVVSKQARRINGQGMTEYIIIVALIALAAITVVGLFGTTIQAQFGAMANVLSGEAQGTEAQKAAKATVGATNAGTLKKFD